MDSFLNTITKVDKSSFDNETDRMRALEEARALVKRLEHPWERVYERVWAQPQITLSFKTAKDLNLFSHLSDLPQSTEQLAKKVGADPALLRRIIRLLVKEVIIEEKEPDHFVHTEYSRALKDPHGLVRGFDVFYDSVTTQQAKLPAYLKAKGYQNPTDGDHPPWKWFEGVEEFAGDRWDFWKDAPERYMNFNLFISAIRQHQKPWPSLYSTDWLIEGWEPETPLLVDVGGGNGRDITAMAEVLDKMGHKARLVLQDRKEVIEPLKEQSKLPERVDLIAHDFFDPNPVKGARAYFLHSVIHDWADSKAHDILVRLKEAMKPGYSKLLLMENVMPSRAKDWTLMYAALDINMMCNFAALERTEEQWRALIEGVGLKYIGYKRAYSHQSIVEAEI